ncbi:hypothetical protein ACFYP4_02415 [Streptomyces sp. NPDC005551]|uniref:hypothetical protein n=1 Tax=Streptomyces sp. NPDC005551 TaxID=3364725 RepID=UPI0036A6B289
MKTWTVVGYSFDADIYCDGVCIIRALGEIGPVVYERAKLITDVTMRFKGAATVEEALKVIAERRGIDPDNERSYDSGDFPKVIFADEEFPDYCPRCALCRGVLDGFDPEDYGDASGSDE